MTLKIFTKIKWAGQDTFLKKKLSFSRILNKIKASSRKRKVFFSTKTNRLKLIALGWIKDRNVLQSQENTNQIRLILVGDELRELGRIKIISPYLTSQANYLNTQKSFENIKLDRFFTQTLPFPWKS